MARRRPTKQSCGKQINTAQAQFIVGETETLIEQHLADQEIEAYERAFKELQAMLSGGKNNVKALPTAPKIGGGSTASRTESAPVGSGYKVTMPGPPNQTTQKTADGVSDIRVNRYVDPTRGTFTVEYWDYPSPLNDDEASKGIEAERERLLSSISGIKLAREAPMTMDNRKGQEIEFELPSKEGGIAMGMLTRIFVVKSRIYSVSFSGTKNDLRGTSAREFLDSFKITGGASKSSSVASDSGSTPPPAKKDDSKANKKGSAPKAGGSPF